MWVEDFISRQVVLQVPQLYKTVWKCEDLRSTVFKNITRGWALPNKKKTEKAQAQGLMVYIEYILV